DLEVLPRFPQARIVDFHEAAAQERIYPQGSIRRISNQLRYERQVLAQGRLTALTYELPASHGANEAFTAARQALQAQGAQLLYWCQGRECGSSSLWANGVFGNAKLFGTDEQQAYLLARLPAPRQDSLLALYSITRGNNRAYLHAEQLQASAPLAAILPTPATLLRQLRDSGELRLVDLGEPTPDWLTLLARSLKQDSTLRVSLSGPMAPAWHEALIEQGVRPARLELGAAEQPGLRLEVLR
ncbi:MAG TPA: DUF4892 domain-containing protein, partial [Pseudomonas sp.]|nr:DUF4892 domain-containing protein [Pseudomonas sp.]